MIQTCTNCKNYDISISDEPCRECQKAFRRGEGKPNFIASITNADRIRSMTDEELAEWLDALITHCNDGPCFSCFMQKACLTSVADWLKTEVESNDS